MNIHAVNIGVWSKTRNIFFFQKARLKNICFSKNGQKMTNKKTFLFFLKMTKNDKKSLIQNGKFWKLSNYSLFISFFFFVGGGRGQSPVSSNIICSYVRICFKILISNKIKKTIIPSTHKSIEKKIRIKKRPVENCFFKPNFSNPYWTKKY